MRLRWLVCVDATNTTVSRSGGVFSIALPENVGIIRRLVNGDLAIRSDLPPRQSAGLLPFHNFDRPPRTANRYIPKSHIICGVNLWKMAHCSKARVERAEAESLASGPCRPPSTGLMRRSTVLLIDGPRTGPTTAFLNVVSATPGGDRLHRIWSTSCSCSNAETTVWRFPLSCCQICWKGQNDWSSNWCVWVKHRFELHWRDAQVVFIFQPSGASCYPLSNSANAVDASLRHAVIQFICRYGNVPA